MLLHCDVVIVAHDARIRFPFTQLGTGSVYPDDSAGLQRLCDWLRAVPRRRLEYGNSKDSVALVCDLVP